HVAEEYLTYVWNTGDTTPFVSMTPTNSFLLQIEVIDSNHCVSFAEKNVHINDLPVVSFGGNQNICVSSTTQLLPDSGVTWVSSDPSIASVQNNGTVTGINPGFTTFQFTNSTTECVSEISDTVWVNVRPVITLEGNAQLCLGDSSRVTADQAGLWYSSNPSV